MTTGAAKQLADLAFTATCNSHVTAAAAVNVSTSFAKAATMGTLLTAEAKEVTVNPRLGTYTIHVIDDTGDAVAVFQGQTYRKKETLESVMGGWERTQDPSKRSS